MSRGYPLCLPAILEQHFDELDFLSEQRERIVFSPEYNLQELAEHEDRVDAHLDGMAVAEMHGIDLARPSLGGDEPFAATAATLTFMAAGVAELAEEVMAAFEAAESAEARTGIRIGLRHAPIESICERLAQCGESQDAALATAAIDVLAFQRVPITGITRLLSAPEGSDRALAYAALGRQRRFDRDELLRAALEDPEPQVRRAALRAAALSGLPGLADLCREHARQATCTECIEFLAVVGAATDLGLLESLMSDPDVGPSALVAVGGLGCVTPVPRLIQLMQDDATAAAAAAAFVRITGADDLDRDPPETQLEQESSQQDSDEDFDAEFEETETLPDAGKASVWWSRSAPQFPESGRFQLGHDVTNALGSPLMNELSLEVRRDLILAAQISGHAQPDIELEARVRRQLA